MRPVRFLGDSLKCLREFPESALWVIGLFVGIDLIFAGWTWIFLALGIRRAFPAK